MKNTKEINLVLKECIHLVDYDETEIASKEIQRLLRNKGTVENQPHSKLRGLLFMCESAFQRATEEFQDCCQIQ